MRKMRVGGVLAGLAVIATAATVRAPAQERPAGVQLEQAMHVERVEGDLQRAITLYQRILAQRPADRKVAATAQLHIGICFETLGLNQAQGAYRQVVQEYPDQLEMVTEARARLTRLRRLAAGGAAAEAAGAGLVVRRVQGDPGFVDGGPTPDGRSFAYIDYETGDVALWNLATGEHRRLTHEGRWARPAQYAINLAVSPDGRNVAYTWSRGGDSLVELRVVGLDDSAPRTLCSNTDSLGYTMSWSPDGRHIATLLYHRADSTGEIAWVSLDNGSMRRLAKVARWNWATLSHSSDGAFIAVDGPVPADSGHRDTFMAGHDIYLVATDGSGTVPLVEHPADDRLLGWVPGSDHLLFLSNRSGDWDVWEVGVAGGRASGEPGAVRRSVGRINPLGFTSDGTLFYALSSFRYVTSVAPFDTATGRIDLAAGKPLLGSNVGPSWSPRGRGRLAVLAQTVPGRGQFTLGVRDLATGEERLLAPQLTPDKPSWFPDGSAILVAAHDRGRLDGEWALYRVDAATGDAATLIGFPPEPSWGGNSPHVGIGGLVQGDGQHLVYVHDSTLLQRDLSSGREVELFRDPGLTTRVLALSPAGTDLVFAVRESTDPARPNPREMLVGAGRLMLISLENGEVRELARVTGPGIVRGVAWAPDGRHVFFVQARRDSGSVLFRVSCEGGGAERVWQTERRIMEVALSPDGGRVAYTVVDAFNEIWAMSNVGSVLEH
jgi:Tol biopolymer transport system component